MNEPHTFSEEDWIVHINYGLGQILCRETKCISGEEIEYFRIQASDSTFWVPVDQINSDLIRPICSEDEIQRAIAILEKPPEAMSSNLALRQSRIKNVRQENTPQEIARLVRDLQAYQREKKGLNQTESSAFRTLKQRLVEEWALVMDARDEEITTRLSTLLDRYRVATN